MLFFTSGFYDDYHEPTDTPEKLDFDLLTKETSVVKQTVRLLADAESFDTPDIDKKDGQQLKSLLVVLQQIHDNQQMFKLDPNETVEFDKLVEQTQKKVSENHQTLNALAFQRETITQLINLLKKHNPILAQYSQTYLEVSKYYSLNPQAFTEAYRQIVRHYLENGIPIIGGRYSFQKDVPITERDWTVSELQDDQYVFCAVEFRAGLTSKVSLIGRKDIHLTASGGFYYCKGSLDELNQYLFLQAFMNDPNTVTRQFQLLDSENDIKTDLSKIECSKEKAQTWLGILTKFRKQYPGQNGDALVPESLRQRLPDLKGWLLSMMKSDNVDIARTAVSVAMQIAKEPAENQLREILSDPAAHIEVREAAVHALAHTNKRNNLLSVAGVLDDKTLCSVEYPEMLDEDYPLKDHPLIADMKPTIKEWHDKQKPKTLGETAVEQLTKVTRMKYDTNKKAWQRWIGKHCKE